MNDGKYYYSGIAKVCPTVWSREKVDFLIEHIFNEWSRAGLSVSMPNEQIPVDAIVTELGEGQSGAKVYQLDFSTDIGDEPEAVASFIIRVILRGSSPNKEDAEQERKVARSIGESKYADYFSARLYESPKGFENVVIYRHADDSVGAKTSSLIDAIIEYVSNDAVQEVEILSRELANAVTAVVSAYESQGSVTQSTGRQFFAVTRDRLVPELMFDARGRMITLLDSTITIETIEGDAPGSRRNKVSSLDLQRMFQTSNTRPKHWIEYDTTMTRPKNTTNGLTKFEADKTRLWIRFDPEILGSLDLIPKRTYTVVFKADDTSIVTGVRQAQLLGYSVDATLEASGFGRILSDIPELRLALRYNDLHSRNIRYGGGRLKIIDLGSLDKDLLAATEARLEVSIWNEFTQRFPMSVTTVESILKALEGQNFVAELNEPKASMLLMALRAVRERAAANKTIVVNDREMELAYVTQILLYQRYHVEGLSRINEGFSAVAKYWIARALTSNNQANTPMATSETRETERDDGTYKDDHSVSLYDLWRQALQTSPGFLDPRAEKVLERLTKSNGVASKIVTEFQAKVWDSAHSLEASPFESDRHVLFAAPTSSGKSTVAEMFLVRTALLNAHRKRALYIAPTRALTQAKHAELLEHFGDVSPLSQGIVVSTGEDTEYDSRIAHGDFMIACLVYEKANILFSQNRRLLDNLGCVVIDEIHMLTDIDRGPTLELAISKIVAERRRIDAITRRSPSNERIRIVAISTEDEPDKAITNFLTTRDYETLTESPPIVIRSTHRPVPVEHVLVLPPTKPSESYSLQNVVTFKSTDDRLLSNEALERINKSLNTAQGIGRTSHSRFDVRRIVEDELTGLLLDLLERNPRGYQVLVFVPSRRLIEDNLARRLRKRLVEYWQRIGSFGDRKREYEELLVAPLEEPLSDTEDTRLIKNIRELAQCGILIHHSDIDRKVRRRIETIFSNISESSYSRVLFATETLSYGVNLAIQDVVLMGTTFYTETRFGHRRMELLSLSAFHNMSGRAGRLGKVGSKKAHVYIVVPPDQDAYSLAKDYYTTIDPPASRLFVADDKAVLINAEDNVFSTLFVGDEDKECSEYRGLDAVHFSNPFVRSILDSLRHISILRSNNTAIGRVPIPITALMEFLNTTLYSRQLVEKRRSERQHERADNTKELYLFKCAIERLLQSASEPPLDLVEADQGSDARFAITTRGEAIIDTGTEIKTVEPLLNIANSVFSEWHSIFADMPFPVELCLLCVIAQEEVLRDYFMYLPESKRPGEWPRHQIDKNGKTNFDQFLNSLSLLTNSNNPNLVTLASSLRGHLQESIAVNSLAYAYPGAGADIVLRLFNSLVLWINGAERSIVDSILDGKELDPKFQTSFRSLRQLTENLYYKVLFLAKILLTGKSGDGFLSRSAERDLYLLALRLRLGCTVHGIPLFWPWSSNFNRMEAVRLINAGLTPARFLVMAHPVETNSLDISADKLEKLLVDLQDYASNQLRDLAREITIAEPDDERRVAIHTLWTNLPDLFCDSIEHYRGARADGVGFHDYIRQCFLPLATIENEYETTFEEHSVSLSSDRAGSTYRLQAVFSDSASPLTLALRGERLIEEETYPIRTKRSSEVKLEKKWQIERQVSVVAMQMDSSWRCVVAGPKWEPVSELLLRLRNVPNLVLVPLPWLPNKDEMPVDASEAFVSRSKVPEYTTTVLSPAAFATLLTVTIRDFADGYDCLELLTKQSDDDATCIVAVKDVLDIVTSEVPAAIREQLIGHFEVMAFDE